MKTVESRFQNSRRFIFNLIKLLSCQDVTQRIKKMMKFTLIELMTIIALIMILISILMPVIGMAKKVAIEVNCASNMKQTIGAGFMMYAFDNNDWLNPYNWDNGGTGSLHHRIWPAEICNDYEFNGTNHVGGYIPMKIARCPRRRDSAIVDCFFGMYAAEKQRKLHSLEKPEERLLILDTMETDSSGYKYQKYYYNALSTYGDSAYPFLAHGRNLWLNVGFHDGHVQHQNRQWIKDYHVNNNKEFYGENPTEQVCLPKPEQAGTLWY